MPITQRSSSISSVNAADMLYVAASASLSDVVLQGGSKLDHHNSSDSDSLPMMIPSDEGVGSNFKVVIRVRPPLPREISSGSFAHIAHPNPNRITISESILPGGGAVERDVDASETESTGSAPGAAAGIYNTYSFAFDYVYDQNARQVDVYQNTAAPAVLSTLQGYNATIFAYGQTGTGKTYTMEGSANSEEEHGIIPRATEDIFSYIQNCPDSKKKFLVRASYLQIYNEVISDLLKPERKNLQIREDKKRGVFVEGLSEWVVRSPSEITALMERGGSIRATGQTRMNELSSRSHAIFIIIVEQASELENEDQSFKIGKLNLVDLAGSERVRYTGATGVRLEESKKINQSLSALGNVIAALTDPRGRSHIPYRDSKLTRILEDSLGGNCKTTMMAMISPALESFAETLSTLKFANRAKNIKNEAHVNEDLNERALLRKYERELKRLRAELEAKSKNVVDKRRLLELEEQKRRAEEDKLAAITALEKRSREFMAEKEAKRKLEERITMMQSQLLIGGITIEDTPAFRNALQNEFQRVHKEYEDRLAQLEKERESIEEDKAQVDRYKQLLLKQRDIMIALTARLNERDETILALQEELDAYDRQQRMLEDALDQKTASLIHLQRVAMEFHANSPVKNTQLAQALGLASNQIGIMIDSHSDPFGSERDLDQWRDDIEQSSTRGGQNGRGDDVPVRSTSVDFLLAKKQAEEERDVLKAELTRERLTVEAFREKAIGHEKEKAALRTILESKMKSLVDSICKSVTTVDGIPDQVLREVSSLQKLVNASVTALKNSVGASSASNSQNGAGGGGGASTGVLSGSNQANTQRSHLYSKNNNP
eukprot:ANDGO_02125.mRNA.1 Kinesin-II 95 kDa subunit